MAANVADAAQRCRSRPGSGNAVLVTTEEGTGLEIELIAERRFAADLGVARRLSVVGQFGRCDSRLINVTV